MDEATEKRWQEDPYLWYENYFDCLQRTVTQIREAGADEQTPVSSVFPPKMSGEVMVPIIESTACDLPRVIVTNIPNAGDFVPGVPRNFAVEIPTLVSKRGIQGIKTDGLPVPLTSYILRDRVAPVEVELEAYETGSKEGLLQLILMDPYTVSLEQARGLLDEILALPEHAAMGEHYR